MVLLTLFFHWLGNRFIRCGGQGASVIDVVFLFGPYCPAYGFGAVAFAVFLPELRNHLFFLFLGGDTVVWGGSAVVCISFVNPSLKELLVLIPSNLGTILLIVLYAVLCLDLAGTVMAIKAVHSRLRRLSIIEDVSENLQKAADMMGEGLTGWVRLSLLNYTYSYLHYAF